MTLILSIVALIVSVAALLVTLKPGPARSILAEDAEIDAALSRLNTSTITGKGGSPQGEIIRPSLARDVVDRKTTDLSIGDIINE